MLEDQVCHVFRKAVAKWWIRNIKYLKTLISLTLEILASTISAYILHKVCNSALIQCLSFLPHVN